MRALSLPLHRRGRSGSAGAGFRLRLRVYLARGRLDRRIAAGCRAESTEALSLRARQLMNPRTRRRIARDLRGTVAYSERVGPGPVSPRGVVLARNLLSDTFDNPLYDPGCERSVDAAVWEVADALGPAAPAVRFDVIA